MAGDLTGPSGFGALVTSLPRGRWQQPLPTTMSAVPREVWGIGPSPGCTKGASEMWGTRPVWPRGAAAIGAGGPGDGRQGT